MFVPQITRVESPPRASASEVSGFRLENVASDRGSFVGIPFSSTKIRLLWLGVELKASEWISPRLDETGGAPELPQAREDLRKRPLLLLGASDRRLFALRVGLELDTYLIGEDSITTSADTRVRVIQTYRQPPDVQHEVWGQDRPYCWMAAAAVN